MSKYELFKYSMMRRHQLTEGQFFLWVIADRNGEAREWKLSPEFLSPLISTTT